MKKILSVFLLTGLICSGAWAELCPQVKFTAISPGRSQVVVLPAEDLTGTPTGEFLGEPLHFFLEADGYKAYAPVPLGMAPGPTVLKVWARGIGGDFLTATAEVVIKAGHFPRVNFSLPPQKRQLLQAEKIADDWSQIEAEIKKCRPEKLWQSSFAYPLSNYYVSLPFGRRETVNGQKRGQHRGVDFGSPQKQAADILAINSGQVVVAKNFNIFGGTVVIDHGQGIYSLYFHLSKIFVTVGQAVNRAAVLGKMGTTGISSGVHLHLGLSVHNERVDPLQWLKGEI